MARYKRRSAARDFAESTAYEVYRCYFNHAQTTDTLPNPHVFWEKILIPQLGYQMPYGSMTYHWSLLQIKKSPLTGEPYIIIDEITKAVRVPELKVAPKIATA